MKHSVVKRYKFYASGDFWAYNIVCSCGKLIVTGKQHTQDRKSTRLNSSHRL